MRSEFREWVPVQLREETLDCLWRYVGKTRFKDPFFEETVLRCLGLPENSFGPPRMTNLDALPEIVQGCDALEPAAFVFHVSRCGSTLVTQLLGLDDGCVALSEVVFFDQLLRARFRPALADLVDVATHLPAAIRLHAQRRTGAERFLVIKFESWQIAFHAELRALYPHTPFILLYRHPAAVVRSHRKRPGMQAVPGLIEPAVFGFAQEASTPETLAAHLPRLLAFYYETFLKIALTDPLALPVAYQPDMVPVVESIARFAGIELSPAHREKMSARAAFHGKYPQEIFHGDPPEGSPDDSLRACLQSYEALAQRQLRGGKTP